jgi:hypothetical protein
MIVKELLPFLQEALVSLYTNDFASAIEYVRKLFPYKQDEIADIVSFKDLSTFMSIDKNSETMHKHGITGVFPRAISFELHNEYVKQFEIISITPDEDYISIKVQPS